MALVLIAANACVYFLAFVLGLLGNSPRFISNWIIIAAVTNSVVDVLVPLLANLIRRRFKAHQTQREQAGQAGVVVCIALAWNAFLCSMAIAVYMFVL